LLGRIGTVSLIGLGIVALLAAVGAYWLAGVALRPLGVMAGAVKGIRASRLDQRLEVSSSDREVRELAAALDTMLEGLQNSFDNQSNVASLAAHELRTPMATLRTSLESIHADPNATVEDYRQLVPLTSRTLGRMDRLISDLLVMAREEASLAQEEVELRVLLADVLEELTPLAREHGVHLKLREENRVSVRGDAALLACVFSNLVENGIRYNHRDGAVTIEVANLGSHACVTISDSGIGIPVEERTRIFQQFYRAPESRRLNKAGSGLGLSIVAHILKLHNGWVYVEGASPHGTRFRVQIPAS
jgi:signal transduction histidine kinase